MALVTPIALPTAAFDATEEHLFYFQANGGDQVTSNTLIVKNSEDVIVSTTESQYSNYNILPANTLENGKQYTFYIITHSTIGGTTIDSSPSNVVQFFCYTTPILEVVDTTTSGFIYSSDYDFQVSYTQNEGELLKEAICLLYDYDGDIIDSKRIDASTVVSGSSIFVNFSGMIDGERYSVIARGITVNETEIESNKLEFLVKYKTSSTYFEVKAENDCENGRVVLTSNLSLIDGVSSSTPIYIDDNSKILLENGDWVEWDENYNLYSNQLTMLKWWTPVQLGRTMLFESINGANKIEFDLKRDYENVCDYVEANVYENGILIATTQSNKVPPLNNTSRLLTYIAVDGENVLLQLNVLSQDNNAVEANTTNSNLQYNRLSDLQFSPIISSTATRSVTTTYTNDDIGVGFQVKRVRIMNSIVDQFYVSNDPTFEFTTTLPPWGIDTVLRPTFSGNLSAGNVDFSIEEVDTLRVKRREFNTLKWFTVYEKQITTYADLKIVFWDTFIKSGKVYEYVVIPVLNDIEGNYNNQTSVLTKFNGFFISDKDQSMSLYSGVTYPNRIVTKKIGILEPYGKKFPKIVTNGDINYQTLTITGNILDPDDLSNLSRANITKECIKWDKFLTNGNTKFIKDWNGNVWIASVTTPPSYSYGATVLIPSVTFTVTEQGDYDDPDVYVDNGFVG